MSLAVLAATFEALECDGIAIRKDSRASDCLDNLCVCLAQAAVSDQLGTEISAFAAMVQVCVACAAPRACKRWH